MNGPVGPKGPLGNRGKEVTTRGEIEAIVEEHLNKPEVMRRFKGDKGEPCENCNCK